MECSDISTACPLLNCDISEAILTEGSCCPTCPSESLGSFGDSNHLHDFIIILFSGVRPDPEIGCHDFDGSFYREGESWHPTLPVQGKVPCVNCTCIVRAHSCCLQLCN